MLKWSLVASVGWNCKTSSHEIAIVFGMIILFRIKRGNRVILASLFLTGSFFLQNARSEIGGGGVLDAVGGPRRGCTGSGLR